MNARTLLLPAVLGLAGLASSGAAQENAGTERTGPEHTDPPRAAPIRPLGECMVARQVRDWGVVDHSRLVVRTLGERYYDVQLSHRCRDLSRRPFLSFRDGLRPLPLGSGRGFRRGTASDPVTSDGRICGDLGDAVVPHSALWTGTEFPCRIASVRRIERRAYDGVFGKSSAEARRLLDASPTLRPSAQR